MERGILHSPLIPVLANLLNQILLVEFFAFGAEEIAPTDDADHTGTDGSTADITAPIFHSK